MNAIQFLLLCIMRHISNQLSKSDRLIFHLLMHNNNAFLLNGKCEWACHTPCIAAFLVIICQWCIFIRNTNSKFILWADIPMWLIYFYDYSLICWWNKSNMLLLLQHTSTRTMPNDGSTSCQWRFTVKQPPMTTIALHCVLPAVRLSIRQYKPLEDNVRTHCQCFVSVIIAFKDFIHFTGL